MADGSIGENLAHGGSTRQLADFRSDHRLLLLAGMALVVGTGGAFTAWLLVKLITLITNLV